MSFLFLTVFHLMGPLMWCWIAVPRVNISALFPILKKEQSLSTKAAGNFYVSFVSVRMFLCSLLRVFTFSGCWMYSAFPTSTEIIVCLLVFYQYGDLHWLIFLDNKVWSPRFKLIGVTGHGFTVFSKKILYPCSLACWFLVSVFSDVCVCVYLVLMR